MYLKLRQRGMVVNHKRVERLDTEADLHVRRRTRKQEPLRARQPLIRPDAANDVGSMDCVFDRRADGRVIKCLTIIDDATHEAVAVVPERAISGHTLTRVLGRRADTRGRPHVVRTDKGKEFCGRARLTWAQTCHVMLRLIEPGQPNQNAYIESFNGRRRDACLHAHGFLNLTHAQTIIETWRREYNEERPKNALGGLTPAVYARHLAERSAIVAAGL